MINWFKTFRSRRRAELEAAGYDHAAGELMRRGHDALPELKGFVASSATFRCYDEFDAGIELAMRDFRALCKSVRENDQAIDADMK